MSGAVEALRRERVMGAEEWMEAMGEMARLMPAGVRWKFSGRKFREVRISRGEGQGGCAERLGMEGWKRLSDLELGKVRGPGFELMEMARGMGCKVGEIVEEVGREGMGAVGDRGSGARVRRGEGRVSGRGVEVVEEVGSLVRGRDA